MHDKNRAYDHPQAHERPLLFRKSLILPLLAALVLPPLTTGANATGVETSGVDTPPWVPDECCELAAVGAVHAPHHVFEPGTISAPALLNNENKATAVNGAAFEPDHAAKPAMALMLVGMGGFIARRRRAR